jgi:hypothetical protein
MKLSDLELAPDDRAKLQEVVAKGSDWRARHRAQTLCVNIDVASTKETKWAIRDQ